MTILDHVIEWDHQAFFFINRTLANEVCDVLLPWVREKFLWVPLYLFILIFSIVRYKWRGLALVLLIGASAGCSDLISAHLIKPWVHRLRPCSNSTMVRYILERISCGSGFSFVSSHASNHFAVASFLMATFGRKWKWVVPAAFIWATLICFAQVYVGVHYPIDVTAGGTLGYCIGLLFARISEKLHVSVIQLELKRNLHATRPLIA